MKQTILSKCFSKMKRVALTLFAALCVGSVWAGYLTFEAQNFAVSEDGTITFNANLGYHGTDTDRYAQLTAVGYNANGEVAFEETKVIGEELTELKLEEDGEGDGCVTYPCTIANSGLSATESYKIEFHFWAVKADGSLSADYDITRYVFPPVGITGVTAKYGDLKFRIFGNIESGYNISAIKVNYIVGTGTPNLVAYATIDAEAGTFACEIPYTPTEYTLTYKVTVEYADGTSKDYVDSATGVADLVKTRLTADTTKVIYTWTGEGDGTSWTDELNWTVNRDDVDTVGYPGTHDGSYYRTMIAITKDVECIDLKGGTYGFVDDGAMYIAANKTVKFKNGKFRFTSSEISRTTADASGSSNELIGSNGGTLIFEKVYLRGCKDNGTESGNLAITPCTGATIVFEGTYSDTWDYYPKSANTGTKIIIRNGELTSSRQLNTYANGSQNDVLISNAMWKVNNASSKTITPYKTLTFRDGPDRQAQIVNTGDLKLANTYDFALPATPYSTPYYKLRKLSATTAGTIKVDVTNYKGGGLVPLIAFSGTLNDATKTAMNTITTTASKLKVTANGEDVKVARNAKLVWNETKKTLYFQQDSQNAASIGTTEYATLGAALDAAADGATITVLNDCMVNTACVIANKTLTIDLNGKTVKANDSAATTDGNGVFWVKTGGVLTLEDSSEEKTGTVDGNGGNAYKMAIWADGGKVVINGGNYVNENNGTETQYDLIYVKNGGEIVINGGTFKCQTPRWTLNSNNTNTGRFVVTGGKFYQYNPTDFDTDEPTATTWCAENTAVIETTENEVKVYTVVPAAAKISNVGYATFDAALEAAVSGDTVKLLVDVVTEKVVVVPTGATLDLNGKSIQALAVVGKLAMNGGALKTYDTNTQTYFFMAAPAQTVGALYWTSDAVMTIGADYTLSLDGGSVTLPNSWRSLLKQKLTIKNGATFVIPQGVELNLRGNAVVEEGATLTCEGTIALGNTYDAIDTSATLTSAQLAEDKVISAVEGYKVQYAGGQYTLVKEGYIVTTEPESSAVTVTADTEAEALLQVKPKVTPPEGVDAKVYDEYFKLVATETAEGSKTWTVALALKDEVKPVIAETTADDTTKEAFVIDAEGNVTLNISNKKPGLYYGVQVLAELGADPVAVVPETNGSLLVPAKNLPEGNAAFFRVVVDYKSIPEAE